MTTAFILNATGVCVRSLFLWDPSSSAARQLRLEQTTSLVSSIPAHVIGIQLLSLLLFFYSADQLHEFFAGAMCAAGSFFLFRQQGDKLFALLGSLLLPVPLVAIVSYLCLHFYERSAHHCPFCLCRQVMSASVTACIAVCFLVGLRPCGRSAQME